MRNSTNGLACALLLSVFTACSGSEPTSNPPTVASLTLAGAPTASMLPGETAQLQATVVGSDGAPMTGQTISWSSSSSAVASVTATGLITAVAAGQAVITASAGGRSATVSLTVVPGGIIGPTGGTILLYGGAATLAFPAQALAATTRIEVSSPQLNDATIVPGTVFEIGPGTFTLSRAAVLTWQYDPSRLPAGVSEASLTLYAAVGANWDPRTTQVDTVANTLTAYLGTSGRYAFVVKPVKYVGLIGVMPELAIGVGQKRFFEVRMFDSTGTQPLAGRVPAWTSSNTATATVNAAGEITGVAPGEVTITATREGVSAAVSLSVLPRQTADWSSVTEWTTFQGSARRSGFVDVTVDPAAIRQLWSVPIGGTAFNYFSPAIGDGTVLISSGASLVAFDATSGTRKWQSVSNRYAPAFGHGRFYVQSFDALLALNPADGNVLFSAPGQAIGDIPEAAPAAVDDAVYTSHGGLRRYNSGSLTEAWSKAGNGHAAVANGLMYTFGTSTGNSGVTALDVSTGQVVFEIAGNTSGLRGRPLVLGTQNNAIGICGIPYEYTGSCLAAFDLASRTQSWVLPIELEGTPSVGQGTAYIMRRNSDPEFRISFEARRESDGQLLWSWFPPPPQPLFPYPHPKGDVIVTRNVLIVGMASGASTPRPNQGTWIVDLATRKQLALLPTGRLAISSQGVLYIATPGNASLTAVALK